MILVAYLNFKFLVLIIYCKLSSDVAVKMVQMGHVEFTRSVCRHYHCLVSISKAESFTSVGHCYGNSSVLIHQVILFLEALLHFKMLGKQFRVIS